MVFFALKVPELRNANATEQKDTAGIVVIIHRRRCAIVIEWLSINPKRIDSP
jgi:hypothetical protein